jgi:hypothetical protein
VKYSREKPQLLLFLALLAAACAWFYTDFVLIPYQIRDAAATSRPRGNLSDLYPRWLGARELLLNGRNPYSSEITREIQAGYYGRPLDPTLPNDPKDQQAFAYPLYVVFLLFPTIRLPFHDVQIGFRWLLIFLTIVSVPLWFRALRWKPSALVLLTWIVITLGCFPTIQGLKLQQLSLVVCALLAACAACVANGALITAGILAALATIKPQLTGIFSAWLLLWSLGDWRARRRLAISFAATMAALLIGSETLVPGWIAQFRGAATDYWQYTGGGKSILDVGLGTLLGKFVALLLLAGLFVYGWRVRREPAHSQTFSWALALVLCVTIAVIPTFALYNQLLLLPAFILVVRSFPELWEKGRLPRFFLGITGLAVVWSWLAAAVADVAWFLLPAALVEKMWAVPLYPSLAVPVAVLGLLIISAREAISERRQTVTSTVA